MATAPVARWFGADLQGGQEPFACIVLGAAHLGPVPAAAQVAGSQLRVSLKPAARQNHSPATDLVGALGPPDHDAAYAAVSVQDGAQELGLVEHRNLPTLGGFEEHRGKAHALALCLKHAAGVEDTTVTHGDVEQTRQLPLYAVARHPIHGSQRVLHEDAAQRRVCFPLGDPHSGCEILLLSIGAHLNTLGPGLAQRWHESPDIAKPLVCEA